MRLQIPCQLRRCFLGTGCLIGVFILFCYYFQFEKRDHTDLNVDQVLTTQAGVRNVTEAFPDGLWTVNSNNRFGNQMGEYATLYALAKVNGKQAAIIPGMVDMLASIFKLTLPHLTKIQEKEIPWRDYWLHDWMSEEFKHIEGKFVKLTGCPNSFTFYHHLRDEIRREFTFQDYLKEQANEYLEKLKGSRTNVTYIGVHVRRGDYVIVMPRDRKGVVADKGYLEKAVSYFRSKYKEPVFVVASNDMKWCKENIDASKGDVYFSGDGNESSPKRDFALLAHCNHTIMTIGSFGHWVAYLAGGETIYLTNFTLPNSPYLKLFRYEASFLPEWIGIPADLSSVN